MTGKISWVIHLFLFYHRENRNEKIPPYGGAGFFRIEEIRMNLPGMEGILYTAVSYTHLRAHET